MRRRMTLEPQIIEYLKDHGNSHIDELISFLHQKTGVREEKIQFRVKKMVRQNKLRSKNGLISIGDTNQDQLDQEYDEVFDYGPIKLARKGNVVFLQSKWEKEEHERFVKIVRENLPKLKQNLEEKFQEVESLILEKFDPLDVLAYVSAKNLLANPETYTESSFQGKQLLPEIIQNIVLKNGIEKYKTEANRDDISQIDEPLHELFHQLFEYITNETTVRTDLSMVEKEIFIYVLYSFLMVRGDAYPQHYKQIALELFSKINNTLKQKGFTIEEYWSTVKELESQIQYNYNEPIKKLLEEHSRFIEFCEKEENRGISPQEVIKKYREDYDLRREKIQPAINKLVELLLKGSFEIQINEKINVKLLDLLSMNFGDNKVWSNPLDKSNVAIKPIIKVNDMYYCFLVVHLIRNVIPIIESTLTEKEKQQTKYHDIKGDFFEEKALELLGNLINGKVYPKLKYPRRNEIDGIIVWKDLIFLIEVKGKKRRVIAGVSDVLRLTKEDFKAHINEAFEQTKKALSYIQSKDEVEFKDKEGTVALKLRRDSIKKVYLINVSLENFSKLALDIGLVKSWDPQLIKGNQYPWIVSIYDLLVISEILGRQSDVFTSYLDQRIKVAINYNLKAIDELDFFGYFLEHGNLTKNQNRKILKSPLIHGYSEKIERWYSYLRGEIESAEKPALKNQRNVQKIH